MICGVTRQKEIHWLEKNLTDIVTFLNENYALTHAHMVNFITERQWNYLNISMQNDLQNLTEIDKKQLLCDDFLTPQRLKQFPHLCKFIQHASVLTAKQLGITKSLKDILPANVTSHQIPAASSISKWHIKLKKQHEVQKMASAISSLAKIHDVSLVVDIGSGKGYLSSYISHFHQLPVLGIEACSKRNESAIIRDSKLSDIFIKKVEKIINNQDPLSDSKLSSEITNPCFPQEACRYQNSRYNCITECMSSTSNLQNIIIENLPAVFSKALPKYEDRKQINETCQRRFSNKYSINGSERSDIDSNKELPPLNVMLCGLHTCGNLAATILKQFISCNLVNVLCSIGCCYNLLTEEFMAEPASEKGALPTEIGFPLSSVLKKMEFSLSRNARLLATQSKERMNHKEFQQTLFYRALLQVILHEQYAIDTTEIHVGRLAGKCHSFQDYVEKALKRLSLDHSVIKNENLEYYLNNYGAEEERLQTFQKLRIMLAPCIESVIVLDWLLFLQEQQCVEEAHLIHLFDPIVSPRCYALIASKKKESAHNSEKCETPPLVQAT